MKLTNLHIFLIILLALVLCSTLGGTCSSEGYKQRYGTDTSSKYDNPTFSNYNKYNKYLDKETTGGVIGNTPTQKHHGKHHDKHHGKHHGQRHGHHHDMHHRQHHRYHNMNPTSNTVESYQNYNDNGYDGSGELNVGDYSDPSGMYSDSSKRSHHKHNDYNSAYRRGKQNNSMFDSVSNGAINGSLFNSSNSYSNGDDYDNGDGDSNGNDYGNGNGNGVSGSQIPFGQEDLYILKSQMVPPICPACPKCPSVNCDNKCGRNKCPPCPACARCPEPQFECKKVPNYSSANIMGNLPVPWVDKLDING